MVDSPITILDHIDKIAVPGNVFTEPANEYWALVWLHQGMEYLYQQVHKCDEVARQQVNPQGNIRIMCSGNCPGLPPAPLEILTCAFHWYAISACQYVRTVGAIAYRQDNAQPRSKDYAKKVIPEVVAFRDKVAAHFAWCTTNDNDNNAERFASILPSVTFADDCYQIAGYTVHLRQSGKATNSTTIQPWSLSKVHERLRERYWPTLRPATETDGSEAKDEKRGRES